MYLTYKGTGNDYQARVQSRAGSIPCRSNPVWVHFRVGSIPWAKLRGFNFVGSNFWVQFLGFNFLGSISLVQFSGFNFRGLDYVGSMPWV